MTKQRSDCLIFDFQDSFTFNIWSELKALGLNAQVIPLENVQATYQALADSQERKVLVHGPGPGHPQDYQHFFGDLKSLLPKKNFFHLGICLGHQIMMTLEGGVIEKSTTPMHGRKVSLKIPEWEVFASKEWGHEQTVQRYNSLSLKKHSLKSLINLPNFQYVVQDDDVLMTYHENQLTYQFHPESVGTSCPNVFFGSLRGFLYN